MCVFSKFVERWKAGGKTWVRYQCNQCSNQEVISV